MKHTKWYQIAKCRFNCRPNSHSTERDWCEIEFYRHLRCILCDRLRMKLKNWKTFKINLKTDKRKIVIVEQHYNNYSDLWQFQTVKISSTKNPTQNGLFSFLLLCIDPEHPNIEWFSILNIVLSLIYSNNL